MQSIQIDGTFSFANNIKSLKIGDIIKLIPNPNNKLTKDAIGAYTLGGLKIGYIGFKLNQIDINAKYTISKINLNQHNPLLLITMKFNNINCIELYPNIVSNSEKIKELFDDLKHFSKFLQRNNNNITKLKIVLADENFINLLIETEDETTIFNTVTKKYYEENIFKYDEFYNFGLIPKNIYQLFQIHRLEVYIQNNYKSIDTLLKSSKFKFNNLDKRGLFDIFAWEDNIENFGFNQIQSSNLILCDNLLDEKLILLQIQYNINLNKYYNSNNDLIINIDNIDAIKNLFLNLKTGGMFYNHETKLYCIIDFYNDDSIIDIYFDDVISKELFVKLLIKLVISNKQIINLYNPIKGTILRLEIPEIIKLQLNNLIIKK